jgi:solute carrier family 25, member 42
LNYLFFRNNGGLKFLSGSLAGVTSQTLTYPLDLARARMAVSTKNDYKSLGDVKYLILNEFIDIVY